MDRLLIAQLAHEVNRAFSASLGEVSTPWAEAHEWQKASILAGVDMHIANPDATPEQSHEAWLEQKTAEGWSYALVKNVEAKQHPCMLPYSELPEWQRAKDYIFRGVVHAALALPLPVPAVVVGQVAPAQASAIAQQVESGVQVRYVGTDEPYTDRLYASKLTFYPQQVRRLPGELAVRFLRHEDVFKRVPDEVTAPPPAADAADVVFKGAELADTKLLAAVVGIDGVPNSSVVVSAQAAAALLGHAKAVDDTAKVLEQAAKEKGVEDTEVNRMEDVISLVNTMEKDALQEYAQLHYGQKVPKNLTVDNMRIRVADLVRAYGKPA